MKKLSMRVGAVWKSNAFSCRTRLRCGRIVGIMTILFVLSSQFHSFGAYGQDLGVDNCACIPHECMIEIDFNRTCDESTFGLSSGVTNYTCQIDILHMGSSDRSNSSIMATIASSYDYTEYDHDGKEIVFHPHIPLDENIFDLVAFSSLPFVKVATHIPTHVEMNIYATDKHKNTFVNRISFTYTNECQPSPIFEEGQGMGWAVITSVESAPEGLCPSAAAATQTTAVQLEPSQSLFDMLVVLSLAIACAALAAIIIFVSRNVLSRK